MEDLAFAQENEDDFDAFITAAALLRCELEQVPLCEPGTASDRIEGGILGTASINLGLKERTFGEHAFKPSQQSRATVSLPMTRTFSCPIAGCAKIFEGTRGGWDGHIGSLRIHPVWHPEILSAEERKKQFTSEFPGFFL